MADDSNIKQEILTALPPDAVNLCEPEIDEWAMRLSMDGKSCLSKVYSQWKSGKKGKENKLNSWTAYYLGLTTKQPEGAFCFERRRAFARPSPPDIDSDFEYERRQEVLDYVVKKYGRGRVGHIGTMGALKMKSAITRIVKALDIANAFDPNNPKGTAAAFTAENELKAKEIKDSIPPQRGAVLKVKGPDGKEHVIKTIKDAAKYCSDFKFYMQRYPEILKHSENIEGLLSQFGIHASGIIISDVDLDKIAPLRTAPTDKTVLGTQFTQDDLESLGLIKFDFLGLNTLSVISRAVKTIEENTNIHIDIENMSLDDKDTFDLYKRGDLVGVFQCESAQMQNTCKEIGVDRFEDIMAAISLFRPGPSAKIPEYCDCKHGRKTISYFHPTIEKHVKQHLQDTYGIPVFQETLMFILHSLAGLTLGEAYVVIKGISKKKKEIIDKFAVQFVSGCIANGVPEAAAKQYWKEFIVPWSGYGFNMAHAAAYAYNSYITAYLKVHFPEEFMSALMNVCIQERYFEKDVKKPQDPPGCKELENECEH